MKNVDNNYQQAIHTIFVTDNDPYDRIVFSRCLKEISTYYSVEAIKGSSDLFSLLHYAKPDIIFLSMDLFSKSCLECLIDIRKDMIWADLPVIVYCSSDRTSNVASAYELGADLFFIKPQDRERLKDLLKMILSLDWSKPHILKESFKENGRYVPLR